MAENDANLLFAVTPLYGFTSDSEELAIGDLFRLVKYQPSSLPPLDEDDVLLRHFRLRFPLTRTVVCVKIIHPFLRGQETKFR